MSDEAWVRRHDFAVGPSIFYYHPGHWWCPTPPELHRTGACHARCKDRVVGASTIGKQDGSGPDGLIFHNVKFACEGVSTLYRQEEDDAWLESGATVRAALEANRLTGADDMRRKGDVGTAAHKVLEQLAEGVDPDVTNGHEAAIVAWWKATRPTPIYSEQPVYDAIRGFAGMFDLQYGTDAHSTMIDLKTGSVRGAAVIQLNAYRIAAQACGLRVPDRLAILDTHEDGTGLEITVPIKPRWATDALAVHNNGRDIGKALTVAIRQAKPFGGVELEQAA